MTLSIERVVDLDPFASPLETFFPGIRLEAVAREASLLAPDHVDLAAGTVLLAVQSHVLRVGGRTILLDTCVGEHKERPRRPSWHRRSDTGFLDRLAAIGLAPEAIDVVMCTHLHADHVGWNTCLRDGRWVPTFANARYLVSRTELAHWREVVRADPQAAHGCYRDSVLPVEEAGQLETVDDGHEIARNLAVVPLAGHTPGQVGVETSIAGRRAVFCADVLHSPLQVLWPHLSTAFCTDADAAHRTRRALLERAAGDGALLVPAHLRGATGMRIVEDGETFRPRFEA